MKESIPLNRDFKRLRKRVYALNRLQNSESRLDKAICNLLDLGGISFAVLLKYLPVMPEVIQVLAVKRIEEFFFFYPQRGRKLLGRMAQTAKKLEPIQRGKLLSAIVDVAFRSDGKPLTIPSGLSSISLELLDYDIDSMRKSKLVEILPSEGNIEYLGPIVKALNSAFENLDTIENFQLAETSLFALKSIGGEGFLRFLINPESQVAYARIRLDWRKYSDTQRNAVLQEIRSLRSFHEDFPQLLLKLVEVSEFGFPFVSMIQEGLSHDDKWVRQIAAASASKAVDDLSIENLGRMLNDPAYEVRLMATTTLGSYPLDKTGDLLEKLVSSEGEALDIRMNALYSLYSQKNRESIARLFKASNSTISTNAKGLLALLMPKDEGLTSLLALCHTSSTTNIRELFHYLMELSSADDLYLLLTTHDLIRDVERKELFLEFLISFLDNRKGPNLEKAISALSDLQQKALKILRV